MPNYLVVIRLINAILAGQLANDFTDSNCLLVSHDHFTRCQATLDGLECSTSSPAC